MSFLPRRRPSALGNLVILSALCAAAAACSTTSPQYFARKEARGRELLERRRWQDALDTTSEALARCDQIDWCAKDVRYQALFHTNAGEAEERLGHRDRAIEHYRKAFYAYPLFFTENYFRMLREAGRLRLLRQEIDVKLANNETLYRNSSAFWLSPETSSCGTRSLAGSYTWTLTASGIANLKGKAALSQTGCVVVADIRLPEGKGSESWLRFRADVHTAAANLLFGPPCLSTDRGELQLGVDRFTVKAERQGVAGGQEGCPRGLYTMEFVKD